MRRTSIIISSTKRRNRNIRRRRRMRIQMRKKAAGLRNHEDNMALGVIGRPQAYKRSNGVARRTADGGSARICSCIYSFD